MAAGLAALPLWAAGSQAPGIPNFHQVNDQIYRGAQPFGSGWENLSKLGIRTVIDLRREGEDNHSIEVERKAVEAAGMHYLNVPMEGIVAPSNADVGKVLAVFESGQKVFVHCKQGKDRTGTVVACYRVAHDHWENRKALHEAKSLGMHWIDMGMKWYIQRFEPAMLLPGPDAAPAPIEAAAPLPGVVAR